MDLQLKPSTKNEYPLKGLLLKGGSPISWLRELEPMDPTGTALRLYPLQMPHAHDQLWGCLAVSEQPLPSQAIGRHQSCQLVRNSVFIPEYTRLLPELHQEDIVHCFAGDLHLFHMELGLVRLVNPVNLLSLFRLPPGLSARVQAPQTSTGLPDHISVFEVHAPPPEQVIQELDEKFQVNEPLPDDSLNTLEKMKLGLYGMLFKKEEDEPAALRRAGNWLSNLFSGNNVIGKMLDDFEQLMYRNQKEMEKLLDMMKKDPAKAMKFALPLDESGLNRGGSGGSYKFGSFRNSSSLFDQPPTTGKGSGQGIDVGDYFSKLRAQYRQSAAELIAAGEYEEAAYIYLKLLKDYTSAASTLERGHLYKEAATVYLKHCKNKRKAAECYERGMMLQPAVALYKEVHMHEKVGDLYKQLGDQENAVKYYEIRRDELIEGLQFLQASQFVMDKLDDREQSESLALSGWVKHHNPLNCLNRYFALQASDEKLLEAIQHLQQTTVAHKNRDQFIRAVKEIHKSNQAISKPLKDILYQLIAEESVVNPAIVRVLSELNGAAPEVKKDINRFVGLANRRY